MDDGRVKNAALTSLVLSVLSFLIFFLAPVAIITGFVALYKAARISGSANSKRIAIAGIVLGFLAIISFVFVVLGTHANYRPFSVPSASMSPTIKPRERIMTDLKAYSRRRPDRGDIVIYESFGNDKRKLTCKRIVGLPGEELEIKNGKVNIDGMVVTIPGLPKEVVYVNGGGFGESGKSVKIPDGFYYVLGDNPAVSKDSRQHGPVDSRDIKGKYLFTYKALPLGRIAEFLQRR